MNALLLLGGYVWYRAATGPSTPKTDRESIKSERHGHEKMLPGSKSLIGALTEEDLAEVTTEHRALVDRTFSPPPRDLESLNPEDVYIPPELVEEIVRTALLPGSKADAHLIHQMFREVEYDHEVGAEHATNALKFAPGTNLPQFTSRVKRARPNTSPAPKPMLTENEPPKTDNLRLPIRLGFDYSDEGAAEDADETATPSLNEMVFLPGSKSDFVVRRSILTFWPWRPASADDVNGDEYVDTLLSRLKTPWFDASENSKSKPWKLDYKEHVVDPPTLPKKIRRKIIMAGSKSEVIDFRNTGDE